MKAKREIAVVLCPGRGSYTKETLGYLRRYHGEARSMVETIDERRRSAGLPTVTELDSADAFRPALHTRGEHASILIHACAAADFLSLDRDRVEVVAIAGNSMGWYTALSCAGALEEGGDVRLVEAMGGMMKEGPIGGQVIYPLVDDAWHPSAERREAVEKIFSRVTGELGLRAHLSIRLGGYAVIGGEKPALSIFLAELPKADPYPFQLLNHAAFHTPLLSDIPPRAEAAIPATLFRRPGIPLVDGRGTIWTPWSTDPPALADYTLRTQVVETFDFTASVTAALKEFAPNRLILLGPGSTLGGAIGQILVAERWLGIDSKETFLRRQETDPFLLAMGMPHQRALCAVN